jgi:hypothetical protein
MNNQKSISTVFLSVALVFSSLPVTSTAMTQISVAKTEKILRNDDATFVFAGRCPNGQPYRLFAHETEIEGRVYTSYNYEGPVGKGTVKTRATPKTMAVRICRVMAEIVDDPT